MDSSTRLAQSERGLAILVRLDDLDRRAGLALRQPAVAIKLTCMRKSQGRGGPHRRLCAPTGLMGTQLVVDCLLNRGSSPDRDTEYFTRLRHDALIVDLTSYLNSHRHFLGLCRLERAQNLNDRGVDLFLLTNEEKIGFQIKSEYDVSEGSFAANVKRQFAEALSHSLTHYFILICASMEAHQSKITHLMNEIELIHNIEFSIYSPNNLVIPFRDRPTVTRDELLSKQVIADDALYDYERGYEHLPEVMDIDIENAQKLVDAFGIDWWDSEGGIEANNALISVVQQKQRQQFDRDFYPTLPIEIKKKRKTLIATAIDLLKKCRACASWSDRSEYKLSSWVENIPEEMIPYTSIPSLLRIIDRLKEYYQIHVDTDAKGANPP